MTLPKKLNWAKFY